MNTHPIPARQSAAAADPRLPLPLRKRLNTAADTAQRHIRSILHNMGVAGWSQFEARIGALVDSGDPPWIRLRGLYAIAEDLLQTVGAHAACRRGCSHCCHIRVDVAKIEAQMLGMAIRRAPKAPALANFDTFEPGYHNPCTFLQKGECTIYEHRPLSCRVHVNLDEDALLCEITEWMKEIPAIPGLALKETFDWAYAQICGTARVADIREYFPPNRDADPAGRR